jgi:hypothetical protein
LLYGLSVIIFHVENTALKIADQLGGLVTYFFVYFTLQEFKFLDCHKAVLDAKICFEHGNDVSFVRIFDFLIQVNTVELILVIEFGFILKKVADFVFVLSDGDCEELK